LREKEQELITALGGDPSPQERLIIADAVKTLLYIGTLDEYLMALDGGIVSKSKVIPLVDTRTKLAGHLRENLRALGLHRRVKTPSLHDYSTMMKTRTPTNPLPTATATARRIDGNHRVTPTWEKTNK
jgi:hypothetical protein